jgi:hypothetical protein
MEFKQEKIPAGFEYNENIIILAKKILESNENSSDAIRQLENITPDSEEFQKAWFNALDEVGMDNDTVLAKHFIKNLTGFEAGISEVMPDETNRFTLGNE